MAYFSENRDSSSAGPKKWNDDALGVMRGEMSSLAKDDKFHDYLKIPVVSRALKYDLSFVLSQTQTILITNTYFPHTDTGLDFAELRIQRRDRILTIFRKSCMFSRDS